MDVSTLYGIESGCTSYDDDSEDTETEEFDEQSPENSGLDRRRTPGKYSPVINIPASQLSQPLSVEVVYKHWCETGKIVTIEPRYPLENVVIAIFKSPRFGLKSNRARCADLCDAVIDAVA
jgi:hypothetical protein